MSAVLEYTKNFAHPRASSKNVHQCKICRYFTTSFCLMVNHVRRHWSTVTPFNCEHSDVEIYRCSDCDFSTKLTTAFKHHLRNYHNVQKHGQDLSDKEYKLWSYICRECSFETHCLLKWMQHHGECWQYKKKSLMETDKVDEEITFKWNTINKTNDKCDLNDFMDSNHVNDNEVSMFYGGMYPHASMRKTAKHKYSLRSDIASPHLHEQNIKCSEKCYCKSKVISSLNIDVNLQHPNEEAIKWYRCNECPFKTKYGSHLKRHINSLHLDEHSVKWHKCEKCPYKAKRKDYLQNHINSHKTNDRSVLKKHVSLQHLKKSGTQWSECEQCYFRTKSNSSLRRHINELHLDEQHIRWYACEKCSFKSKRKYNLKVHVISQHSRGKSNK